MVARRAASASVMRTLRPIAAQAASISEPAMSEAHGAHHGRRKLLLVGDADGQIRRSPEDVHQGKGQDDLQTMMAIGSHRKER